MWDCSVIDSASIDDGHLSAPAKHVVSHRHSQQLIDSFMAGDFPGSRARIRTSAGILQIILQVLLLFIPGTVCEVLPNTWPKKAELARRMQRPKKAEKGHASVLEEEEGCAGISVPGAGRPAIDEDSLADIVDDFASCRWIYFLTVPKVKFVVHQIFYMMYCVLPLVFLFGYAFEQEEALADANASSTATLVSACQSEEYWIYGLPDFRPDTSNYSTLELLFWLWNAARILGELEEVERCFAEADDSRSLPQRIAIAIRLYLNDPYNKLEIATSFTVFVTAYLRLTWCDDGDFPDEVAQCALRCINRQISARCVYAVTTMLAWVRLVQIIRFFESAGVLSICFAEIFTKDVSGFVVLTVVISFGFGAAFAVLDPVGMVDGNGLSEEDGRGQRVIDSFISLSSPFWLSAWGLVQNMPSGSSTRIFNRPVYPAHWLLPFLALIYLFVAAIVLVNLLIAAMSSTYEEIRIKGMREWQFERAKLIREYKDRKTALPPPFNVLWIASYVFRALRRVACGEVYDISTGTIGYKLQVSEARELRLSRIEADALKRVCADEDRHSADEHRAERLEAEAVSIQSQQEQYFEKLRSRMDQQDAAMAKLAASVEKIAASAAQGRGGERVECTSPGASPARLEQL